MIRTPSMSIVQFYFKHLKMLPTKENLVKLCCVAAGTPDLFHEQIVGANVLFAVIRDHVDMYGYVHDLSPYGAYHKLVVDTIRMYDLESLRDPTYLAQIFKELDKAIALIRTTLSDAGLPDLDYQLPLQVKQK